MSEARPHLKTLEEIELTCVTGLVEVLRTEGVEGVGYALWDMTGWYRDYDPCVWRSRADEKRKRIWWEMWVKMEKIVATVLHEAHERQVGEAMDYGPSKSFFRFSDEISALSRERANWSALKEAGFFSE